MKTLHKRFVWRATQAYQWMYFNPLRCTQLFRIDKLLHAHLDTACLFVSTERYRFIYQPIPKVGCTTMKSLVLDAIDCPIPDNIEKIHILLEGNKLISHGVKRAYWDDMDYKDQNVFSFAFVRNPWARLISCYHNKVLKLRPYVFDSFAWLYPGTHFERMSFTDFVHFICRIPNDLCEPHFKPQSLFFNDRDVDFVGRLENFSNDLTQIIERIGLDEKFLKWCALGKNLTPSKHHYTDFYNIKTRRLVAEKYKSDIAQFNYRFGE